MRLAYLVSQYPAFNHTFILREIRSLRALGFAIGVVSIRRPDRPPAALNPTEQDELQYVFSVLGAPGKVLAAHAITLFTRPLGYLKGIALAFRLAGADLKKLWANFLYFAEAVVAGHHMRRLGVSHFHSHFSSTVALFVIRVFPLTYSVTLHGPDEFNDVIGFHIAGKIARARFVVTISSYARSQAMKASDSRDWDKIEVARLGVDGATFTPRPHRDHPERFEILCVGRLAPAKAQQVLLGALDILIREGRRSIHLRLVGEGPDRPALEAMIAGRSLAGYVTLEGACNQERVREFYQQTDLFALASFAEGVPVVLMEAMAMEIPCVATGITGVPELIRHGVDGWLVPPGDESQFAEAIAHLMDDPGLRRSLGESARRRVLAEYDLSRNVEALAAIYRRRLSSSDS